MNPMRSLAFGIFLLGIAATASFHAGGAVHVSDALTAAAFGGGATGGPQADLTSRALGAGVALVRTIWAPTGVFRAMHLAAGILLALAAALSARVAATGSGGRAADAPILPGLAAGIAIGTATLFGHDLGGLGLLGGPVALLLTLLAGSAALWTAPVPRAFSGGALLGAAVAASPIVLFLLPAFGGLVMGAPLRLSADRSGGFVRRSSAGFLVGLATLGLPLLDTGASPSLTTALASWWGGEAGAFWALGAPSQWGAGVVSVLAATHGNAGLLGLILGWAGLAFFFSGGASRLRPFLLGHVVLALALILGDFRDAGTARALAGWTFLFWMAPTLAFLHERMGGARSPLRSSLVGMAVGGVVLLANGRHLDRSDESGVGWARATLDPLPADAVLLTDNPVHAALAADGIRPDVLVVHPGSPSAVDDAGERPVVVDPSIWFDVGEREAILGTRWKAQPWGAAFRLVPAGEVVTNDDAYDGLIAWENVSTVPDLPASRLRGGLTADC